ncbi:MAG: 4-carboxymuconolactone decarboxylase [Anaerolineae bacterium]|nr:4-carboxymuconolactone decarboxylase [Anaerolineae bacterium]
MTDNNHEAGMKLRRQVLGDEHVDRSWNQATDFDRDFQDFITKTAWGSIWSRPGLDLKTRHMITVAVLAALGREKELTLHINATPNTGITPEEMRELLLQVAGYAGIPAANSAFAIAKKLFADQEAG